MSEDPDHGNMKRPGATQPRPVVGADLEVCSNAASLFTRRWKRKICVAAQKSDGNSRAEIDYTIQIKKSVNYLHVHVPSITPQLSKNNPALFPTPVRTCILASHSLPPLLEQHSSGTSHPRSMLCVTKAPPPRLIFDLTTEMIA